MPNISAHVPSEIFEEYQSDAEKKGLVARLLAQHYGFKIQPKYVKELQEPKS